MSGFAISPEAALLDPSLDVASIFRLFGGGRQGAAMVLAHIITWKTDSYVYGGFIRDFILRQDLYDDSDLDISLNGLTFDQAIDQLTAEATQMGFTLRTRENKGEYVTRAEYVTTDGCSVQVEFVDYHAAVLENRWVISVDFNVNNLKVEGGYGGTPARIQLRFPEFGGSLEEIREDLSKKTMSRLYTSTQTISRTDKFRQRGWTVNIVLDVSEMANNFFSEGGYYQEATPKPKHKCGHEFCWAKYKLYNISNPKFDSLIQMDPDIAEFCCGYGFGGIPPCCKCDLPPYYGLGLGATRVQKFGTGCGDW